MKLKSTLSLICISIFCISANAQQANFSGSNSVTDENAQKNIFSNILTIVNYNANVLGFSKYCRADKNKAQSVLNNFNAIVSSMNLSKNDSQSLETAFNKAFTDASNGKNLPANFTCPVFLKSFDDIYNFTQTGKAP